MNQCQRCLKITDGIHTCNPSDYARKIETERKDLAMLLLRIVNKLEKNQPCELLATAAIVYMTEKQLMPSPLRREAEL